MDPHRLAAGIEQQLRAHGDPARAVKERAYLKSTLDHIGVPVPVTRKVVRAAAKELTDRAEVIAVARALWEKPIYERRLSTVELLAYRTGSLTPDDLPFIESLLRQAKTWALVDHLAEAVAGDIVRRNPAAAEVLDRWAIDPDFWIRRSALLALLGPVRKGNGDLQRFSRYADGMLDEREFFIRKAIGWVLREIGKRNPEWVADWLAQRQGRVPALAVREAVKYLPDTRRS